MRREDLGALFFAFLMTFTIWGEVRPLVSEALVDAVRDDSPIELKAVLAIGADARMKDDSGMTVLMYAVMLDRKDAVRSLLESGAEVNAKDMNGRTALMRAAQEGDTQILQDLLDYGADVGAIDNDDETALVCAVKNKHRGAIRLLTRWEPSCR